MNDQFELPLMPFDSAEFQAAWDLWLTYRKKIKQPINDITQRMQLNKLGKMKEKDAIRMIEYTMEMGWIGLREPEVKGYKRAPARPAQVDSPRPKGSAPDELYEMGAKFLREWRKTV